MKVGNSYLKDFELELIFYSYYKNYRNFKNSNYDEEKFDIMKNEFDGLHLRFNNYKNM